jgi:hypothetical protein
VFSGQEQTTYDKGSEMSAMGNFNMAVEEAIIDALAVKKGEPIDAVLAYALEMVQKEYPFATEQVIRKTYNEVMYD